MAVFYNKTSNAYALVSFKSLYSRFTAADTWDYLAVDPTPRMLARAVLRGAWHNTWFVVRSPYDRIVSCFMDKYRKQPMRIESPGFSWQHCHQLLYPYLNINSETSDAEIADRFLQFTFDDFLKILPNIYQRDGHFKPQFWSARLLIGKNRSLPWPSYKIVRVEDPTELTRIPDIDFNIRTNTTGQLARDFQIDDRDRNIIRALYAEDFRLGRYPY